MYIAKYIDNYYKDKGIEKGYEKILKKNLSQYLLFDEDDKVYFPGNYSLRLSFDIATGLTGLLIYNCDYQNKFCWLPIVSQKELFNLK